MLPLILSSTPRSRPFHVNTPYASPLRPLGRVRTRVNLQNVSPYRSGSVIHALFANVLPNPPFGSVDASSYKFGRTRIFGKSSTVRAVPGAFTAAAARFTASRIPLRTFGPRTADADMSKRPPSFLRFLNASRTNARYLFRPRRGGRASLAPDDASLALDRPTVVDCRPRRAAQRSDYTPQTEYIDTNTPVKVCRIPRKTV